MIAYNALTTLQKNPNDEQAKADFEQHSNALGYGLLLKKYTENVTDATEEQINQAAQDLKPKVIAYVFFISNHGCLWFVFYSVVCNGFLSICQT